MPLNITNISNISNISNINILNSSNATSNFTSDEDEFTWSSLYWLVDLVVLGLIVVYVATVDFGVFRYVSTKLPCPQFCCSEWVEEKGRAIKKNQVVQVIMLGLAFILIAGVAGVWFIKADLMVVDKLHAFGWGVSSTSQHLICKTQPPTRRPPQLLYQVPEGRFCLRRRGCHPEFVCVPSV